MAFSLSQHPLGAFLPSHPHHATSLPLPPRKEKGHFHIVLQGFKPDPLLIWAWKKSPVTPEHGKGARQKS